MFKVKIIREIMFSYLHTLLRSLTLPSSVLPDRETRLYMVSGKTSVDIITEPSSVVTFDIRLVNKNAERYLLLVGIE